MKCHALLLLSIGFTGIAFGQSDVGFVRSSDATVTGALIVGGGNTILGPSSTVKTADRPAKVILSRGGLLNVCQSSTVRLKVGQSAPTKSKLTLDPMHVFLDHGSMEIQVLVIPTDSITAAGMRFSSAAHHDQPDMLHLSVRVSGDGGTCVENQGDKSPPLSITDATGHPPYLLKPGRHVLFAHGSVQEISSADSLSCGCSLTTSRGSSLASAAISAPTGSPTSVDPDAPAFPFPTAESKTAHEPPAIQPEVLDAPRIKADAVLEYDPATAKADLDMAMAPPLFTNVPNQSPGKSGSSSLALLQDLPPSSQPDVKSQPSIINPAAYMTPPEKIYTENLFVRFGRFLKRILTR